MRKNVSAKVYSSTGQFITVWDDIKFRSFTSEINAGPGACVLTLPLAFDYAGSDLIEGNDVRIDIADKDTALTGFRQVYRGYISLIERNLDKGGETITVTLLGHYTRLSLDVLKDGNHTTLFSNDPLGLTTASVDQEPADIGLMARSVIQHFQEENPGSPITTSWITAPDTGTDVTYTFEQKTYREALDKLRNMAPVGTFYFIDENGHLTFGQKPATPTHSFTLGKHFTQLAIERSLEKVRNSLLLWNGKIGTGQVYESYEDDASINLYGRRTERANDYGVVDAASADTQGANFLADNRRPEVKVTCTIMDNSNSDIDGYDIESIRPGHTCTFYGFSPDSVLFNDNMLITKVTYYLDQVVLEVEVVKSGLVDFQEQQGKAIKEIGSGGLSIPASYT